MTTPLWEIPPMSRDEQPETKPVRHILSISGGKDSSALAVYMRVLRTDMIATLREDFITMARAKGMSTSHILLRHALRPSTFALVTVAGINVGALISGVFIVEYIFQLPGLGLLTLNSIYARDYLVVQGTVLVVAAGFVLVNLFVDFLYVAIDPRTRHARAAV